MDSGRIMFMNHYNMLFTKTLSPLCERGFLWGLFRCKPHVDTWLNVFINSVV